MATKKKPASKKASKPVKKVTKKPAPKKPAAKAAPKKAAKSIVKKATPQKPAAKVAAKKPAEKPVKPIEKKAHGHEHKSLVSVKPQILNRHFSLASFARKRKPGVILFLFKTNYPVRVIFFRRTKWIA